MSDNKQCNPWLFRPHRWSQWNATKTYVQEATAEVVLIQVRICECCGLTQIKRTST